MSNERDKSPTGAKRILFLRPWGPLSIPKVSPLAAGSLWFCLKHGELVAKMAAVSSWFPSPVPAKGSFSDPVLAQKGKEHNRESG